MICANEPQPTRSSRWKAIRLFRPLVFRLEPDAVEKGKPLATAWPPPLSN